jgi:hypothetical protein
MPSCVQYRALDGPVCQLQLPGMRTMPTSVGEFVRLLHYPLALAAVP